MATLENPEVIKDLLLNGGVYEDDPPAVRIYEYLNVNGSLLYSVFWRLEDDDMHVSPFVTIYKLLMEHGELTPAGHSFLTTFPK